METQTQSIKGTKAFAWLTALAVLAFMTASCGQAGTGSEDNADDAPPANAPTENAPADDQADDQGDDQADDQDNDNS